MIKLRVDTSDFEELDTKLKMTREYLTESGVQKWLGMLLGDGRISIESNLKNNIMDLVYMQPTEMIVGDEYRIEDEPNFYERTERLYRATKVTISGNQINLYMDDETLGTRGNLKDLSKGTATNLGEKPYSLRVENDFVYENNYGVDVLRKGDSYMEKTFIMIRHRVLNGDLDPKQILTPILGVWKG